MPHSVHLKIKNDKRELAFASISAIQRVSKESKVRMSTAT